MGAYVPTGGGSSSGPTTTPADNLANPAAIPSSAAFGLLWDPVGAQWVRARTAQAVGTLVANNNVMAAGVYLGDSGGFAPWKDSAASNTDAVSAATTGMGGTVIPWLADNAGNINRQHQLSETNGGDGQGVALASQPSSVATEATAAANTAVTTTYAAVASQRHRLTLLGISWSGAAATTGLLTVQDGATTILSVDVPLTLNAPFFVPFPPGGIKGTINTAMTITLAAGGAGAIGKLNTAKLTG